MLPLAAVHNSTGLLTFLFLVVALGCLIAAGYMAYLRNVLACGLLLLVAVVAVFIALG